MLKRSKFIETENPENQWDRPPGFSVFYVLEEGVKNACADSLSVLANKCKKCTWDMLSPTINLGAWAWPSALFIGTSLVWAKLKTKKKCRVSCIPGTSPFYSIFWSTLIRRPRGWLSEVCLCRFIFIRPFIQRAVIFPIHCFNLNHFIFQSDWSAGFKLAAKLSRFFQWDLRSNEEWGKMSGVWLWIFGPGWIALG